jgi:ParB-like chromosome segregation protein Spo0J
MKIRDRIKSLRRVRAGDLIPNPRNWRTHPQEQQDALRGVLAEVGYADALLVREAPEGLVLIDGHLRAGLDPEAKVPVLVLDVTAEEADKIMLTLDPLAAMAEADQQRLEELLREIETGSDAVQSLLNSLAVEAACEESAGTVELKQLAVKPPPRMTWVLIGIPTVSFGSISEVVETVASIPDTIVETTANDGKED